MRRSTRHAFKAFVVAAAILLIMPASAGAQASTLPDEYRRIVLVPGIEFDSPINNEEGPFNACERARETFAPLIDYLKRPAPYWSFSRRLYRDEEFIAFSYNTKWISLGIPESWQVPGLEFNTSISNVDDCAPENAYVGAESRNHVILSAVKFDAQYKQWRINCPQCRFEVIAHSLGGAVTTYWAANIADEEDLAYVHSLITIDSPIEGVNNLRLKFGPIGYDGSLSREAITAAGSVFLGNMFVAGGDAGAALRGQATGADDSLPGARTFLADLKKFARVDMACFAHVHDILVRQEEAWRPSCDYRGTYGTGFGPEDFLSLAAYQGAILRMHTEPIGNPQLHRWIDLVLVNNGGEWRRRADLRTSEIADRDSRLTAVSRYPVVLPGAAVELEFTLRNNGLHPWSPETDDLRRIGGNVFEEFSTIALDGPVAAGKTASFRISTTAPMTPGVYTGEWQLHAGGLPYGSRVYWSVIVLTEEQRNPGGFIAAYLGKAWEDTKSQVNQLAERARVEAERLVREAIQRQVEQLLAALCGAPVGAVIATGGFLFVRTSRRRRSRDD